tara:strand:+ start:857 stop:991 length:135 start_codon:yes stop_codon:yes gene_type:complete
MTKKIMLLLYVLLFTGCSVFPNMTNLPYTEDKGIDLQIEEAGLS